MRLQYDVSGAGWATIIVECRAERVEIVASYLNDSLRELARAAWNLTRGSTIETVSFLDEPGEHRLTFERIDEAQVRVRVEWYEGWLSVSPSLEPKERRLCCTTTVAHVRGQVYAAMKRLVEELGVAGYKDRWVNHPFPEGEYAALARAIA